MRVERLCTTTPNICLLTKLFALLAFLPSLVISQSRVRYLPGFAGPLPFHLETGYVGVGESDEHQLFYYFVKSESNPKENPLLLWLNGGPGCTSWTGFVYEIGPLYYEYAPYDGSLPTLKLREHAWTKVASIIFLDAPAPTGFSFSTTNNYDSDDLRDPKEIYQFLVKWLTDHPQFLSNPLYIAGDSYSGLVLPTLVDEIVNGIEAGNEPIFNLKGYILGNPSTDRGIDQGAFVPHSYRLNLIPVELYESVKQSCGGALQAYAYPSNPKCQKDIEAVRSNIGGLEITNILEPPCAFASPKPPTVPHARLLDETSRELHLPDPLPPFGCRAYWHLLSAYWANDANVRKALHVSAKKSGEWKRCDYSIPYVRNVNSTVHYHLKLTTKGYRALIYSGDHDMLVPIVGTEHWIKSLNFSIVDDWRPWIVDGQVAGYTRAYANNFTFATVKGAGHTAPEYMPKQCFAMFQLGFEGGLMHRPPGFDSRVQHVMPSIHGSGKNRKFLNGICPADFPLRFEVYR